MVSDKTALKVGIASFLMIIVLAGLLVWKSTFLLSVSGYQLIGTFETVNGLLDGAEVRYRGLKVGRVAKIRPGAKDIKVHFYVDDNVSVPKGSTVKVIFDGLIGEKFLAINPINIGEGNLSSGATVQGFASKGLSDFIEVGTENLEEVKKIVESLSSIFKAPGMENVLGEIVQDVHVITEQISAISEQDKLNQLVESFQSFSEALSDVVFRLNNQVLTDDVANNISQSAANFAVFSDKVITLSDRLELFLLGDEHRDPSSALNLFKTITTMRIIPGARVQYSSKEELSTYVVNMDWDFGTSYIRTAIGDRNEQDSQLMNFQYGVELDPWIFDYVSTRLGLFYAKPGIGFDVSMLDRLAFEMEAYDFNEFKMELTTKLRLIYQLNAILNIRENPAIKNRYDHLSYGLSIQY